MTSNYSSTGLPQFSTYFSRPGELFYQLPHPGERVCEDDTLISMTSTNALGIYFY